jgi:hypothetical protein
MKWIEASERLPELRKQVYGKLQGRLVIVENSNLVEGYITANGNLEPVNLIEWLDESNLPVNDTQDTLTPLNDTQPQQKEV